ncbi:MarC family protein [Leucothrix sargassi]|nr:MarC family protein [Leucothrix sargassi]
MIDFVAVFITFFAVIDPIGTVPVFIAVTAKYDAKTKRKIALLATLAAAGILLFFILIGEVILTALAIPLSAFQIAGGIVLFLFALQMIFGDSKPEEEMKLLDGSHQETAIFPLAVPSIASPGAMLAAVLLTKNAVYSVWEQAQTALVMLLVLFIAYLLMLLSGLIGKLIGNGGASVISRVMGMILASIATTNILMGLADYYKQI